MGTISAKDPPRREPNYNRATNHEATGADKLL